MESKLKKEKEAAMLADLYATKAETVLAALERIHDGGSAAMIRPLLETYLAWPAERAVQEKVKTIMLELKTESAIPELINALDNPDFSEVRSFIISVFWNAGLSPAAHVDVLVRHAIQGDFEIALESITAIESTDDAIDTETIQHCLLDLEEFIEEHPEAGHLPLLKALKEVLTEKQNPL